jgi:hypothetical protein
LVPLSFSGEKAPRFLEGQKAMRRGLFILALFVVMAMSGKDAHARFSFGTDDTIHHLQDLKVEGKDGEALYLGFLTSTHSFLLPYSMSDRGHVLGVKGARDKYYKLPKEMLETMQLAGLLPKQLPAYKRPKSDYLFGYALWPVLLLGIGWGLFQARGRSSGAYETRSA